MKVLKKLAVLSLCPFYITNGQAAEEMGKWFEQTWKELTGNGAQNITQQPLMMGGSSSIQFDEYDHSNPSFELQSLSSQLYPVYPTPYSNNTTNFYQNSAIPQQLPVYYQPGISPDPIRTSAQTSNQTSNQASNGLLLQTSLSTNLTTISIPRPPERTHFITKEEVVAMKNDKECTNQLLDLIYWNVVDNCYTLDEIKNNKNIQQTLKSKPDHRLWSIIYNLDAFSHFPGLVDAIKKYADGGLATAQYILGHMHKIGRGVPKDLQKGVNYWRLSAAQGHAKSQVDLGDLCMIRAEGVGVLILAANQGFAKAKAYLGKRHYNGDGVEKSEDQALKYFFDANLEKHKDDITTLLTPVSTYGSVKSFSEKAFFANIEEELIQLVSLYHSDVPLDNSYSSLLETHRTKLSEHRSWIYDTLTKEAIPLVKSLKTVAPGFEIDCLRVKDGVTISRAKTNPAPAFFSANSSTFHINLGEENVVISAQLHKVTNFFYEAGNKLDEILNIKENSKNEANSSPILEKKNSLLDLGNKIVSLNQLLEQASEEEKPIYQKKILKTQCEIKIINTEISNLQKNQESLLKDQEAVSILVKESNKFKPVGKLLIDYCVKGAAGRNEYFLETYPYLRAK